MNVQNFQSPGVLLGLAVTLLLALTPAVWGKGKKTDDGAFPSVKEALEKEIRGRWKLKKNTLDVVYDFKEEKQAEDFQPGNGYSFVNGKFVKDDKPPRMEPGKLYLKKDSAIESKLPMGRIQSASFWVRGIKDFNIDLHGSDRTKGLDIAIGNWSRVVINNAWDDLGIKARPSFHLSPTKPHRIELTIDKRRVIVKLDGSKILEEKLPRDFEPMSRLSFSTAAGKGYLTALRVKGEIAADAALVAANRGRGPGKQPPLWPEVFTATGEYYTVISPQSQENAESWRDLLESQVKQILETFPLAAPPAAEPADAAGNQESEAPGSDVPETQTPETQAPETTEPRLAYKKNVYLFQNPLVLQAYTTKGPWTQPLPSGDFAVMDPADSAESAADPRLMALRLTATSIFAEIHPSAPYWWNTGTILYYAMVEDGPGGAEFGALPATTVNAARTYLTAGTNPRLSDFILTADRPTDQKSKAGTVVSCWMHFLHRGESGQLLKDLQAFHHALRAGKGAVGSAEEVFPVSRFNELYPKFEQYLEGL